MLTYMYMRNKKFTGVAIASHNVLSGRNLKTSLRLRFSHFQKIIRCCILYTEIIRCCIYIPRSLDFVFYIPRSLDFVFYIPWLLICITKTAFGSLCLIFGNNLLGLLK